MKTRIIHTKIWTDSFFLELSYQERYLFLYYLMNPHVNIIHLYECPTTITSVETGLTIGIIKNAKTKFEKAGKMYFFKNYIYLKNASKYETYTGELNEKAKSKLLHELSKDVLDWYKAISDTPIDTPLIPSITHNTENITYKKEQENKKMNEDVNPDDIPF